MSNRITLLHFEILIFKIFQEMKLLVTFLKERFFEISIMLKKLWYYTLCIAEIITVLDAMIKVYNFLFPILFNS